VNISYLPLTAPGPQPNEDDAPFWVNCNQRR
jgi:hypothetical protein